MYTSYVKQQHSGPQVEFTISDQEGQVYQIKNRLNCLINSLDLTDSVSTLVAGVKQKNNAFQPLFGIDITGNELTQVAQRLSFDFEEYRISLNSSDDTGVDCHYWASNFEIKRHEELVCQVRPFPRVGGAIYDITFTKFDKRAELLAIGFIMTVYIVQSVL